MCEFLVGMQITFKWLFLIAQILLHTDHIEQCAGDAHSITGPFSNGYEGMRSNHMAGMYLPDCTVLTENILNSTTKGSTFLERTLFTRNNTMPKSYVVGFKYVSDIFGRNIYHGIIHSNAKVSIIGFAWPERTNVQYQSFTKNFHLDSSREAFHSVWLKNTFTIKIQLRMHFRIRGVVEMWIMELTYMTSAIWMPTFIFQMQRNSTLVSNWAEWRASGMWGWNVYCESKFFDQEAVH